MAFHKFVAAIQTARGVLFRRMSEPTATPPADQARDWQTVERTADIWLTPDLVKDYAEEDFQFLSLAQRVDLRDQVTRFKQLAESVRGRTPSAIEVREGYELVAKINGFLGQYAGESEELQRIAEAIRPVPSPDYIVGVDCRLDTDWTGDPAVRIWLVLNDDVEIESLAVQDELHPVRRGYREAIQRAGIDRWPYIGLRTRSETKELISGAA